MVQPDAHPRTAPGAVRRGRGQPADRHHRTLPDPSIYDVGGEGEHLIQQSARIFAVPWRFLDRILRLSSRAVRVRCALRLGIYWRAVVLDRRFERAGGRGRPPSRKFPRSLRTSFGDSQKERSAVGLRIFSWRRPSGRCFRAENSSRRPGGSPVPRKILKLSADPTKSVRDSCRVRIADHCGRLSKGTVRGADPTKSIAAERARPFRRSSLCQPNPPCASALTPTSR